jgi:hypothetical protein
VRANPGSGMRGWKNDELKHYLAECSFAERIIFTGICTLD